MRNDNQYGTKLLCVLLIAVAVAAVVISTVADVDYWLSSAKTPLSQFVYGGGAVVFRAATILFAAVIAIYMRKGHYGKGIMAGCVLLIFSAISMSSVIGFGSRERMAPTIVANAKLAAEIAAKQQTETLAKSLRDEQIAFLREQAKKARGPQSRQVAYDALGTATFGNVEIKAAPVLEVTDPQAEALHQMFPSWSIQSIQLAMTFAWGIGLIFCEMVLMGVGVGLWPKPDPSRKAAIPVADEDEDDDRPSAEIIRPEQFAARPAPAMAAEPYVADDLDVAVEEALSAVEQIEEFWKTQTRPAAAARIQASTMYRAYTAWCGGQEINPASQQLFGRESKKLGYDKDKSNKSAWFYTGRALISSEHESLMVA